LYLAELFSRGGLTLSFGACLTLKKTLSAIDSVVTPQQLCCLLNFPTRQVVKLGKNPLKLLRVGVIENRPVTDQINSVF
jgi:hypothetical protein